jgi:hypothetical protein
LAALHFAHKLSHHRLELPARLFDGRDRRSRRSGIWTFEQDGDFVNVTYDWTIRANKRIIEKLSFLLKPIFRSNHNWTMKRGAESLRLEVLRRRAKSDEELASIPAGPRPSLWCESWD